MFPVLGNIHIHTAYSDGSSGVEAIARDAAASGLDFIIITDHHTLRGLAEEGYHHGVLVLCGSEINRRKHHYLALGISEEIAPDDDNPQAVIDAVNRQGGLGFIAHPFEKGSPLVMDGITYPWENWEVDGFCGIEVWNWCSAWRDGVQTLAQGLYYAYLNPEGPITGPCPEALARFDLLTQKKRLTAIAGSDAHDWHIRRGPLCRRIFPYSYLFRTATNCLLLPAPLSPKLQEAKAQIYTALRRGRNIIVNRLAAEADGFYFCARAEAAVALPGESIPFTPGMRLVAACPKQRPRDVTLILVHNGHILATLRHNTLDVPLEAPGTYRLEAYLKKKPWIFTNPVYIV
ncbi:MAG TPA: CehA/McbA family metallohydrolase [Firmicutes bacterium]|nr:CehA/McbA family metallohydrolase [Bacillota bacterium]